ncbi:glutamate decarboxylase B, PLP-dependent [Carnobacterium maltaromaticum]|uniref:glutamate decarboxylase n=1 Tax=Carnobacterium maltaromaticum TaxID=2751 RepID=UPI00191B9C39|nr:glutamate decarboxylase [Carnobacterium maltaromaticum]CAD5899600.1 glutamate decarboxylase B, PLP-dependent [Carnobacterium maltaromaticum]
MFNNKIEKKIMEETNCPIFGSLEAGQILPNYKIGKESVDPRVAYQLVKDQLVDEGNARQNLATFCQTYMEPEAEQLMAETFEKNAIDKSEYPQTAKLESSCVNMIADLWNASEDEKFMGTSTVGSSEGCMLGGMAMKFRWRNLAEKRGLDIQAQKPNLVISSGFQVCWEKFCVYWDIEMREVPMDEEHLSINLDKVMDYVDEYTIGIVGILGITYTGKFDDIAALDTLVESYNQINEHQLVIHVDAASGGMFVPFVNPELAWDFRLKNVVSINTSGHKYGLVYPGVGWILWRDEEYLPKELVFDVSYLGGHMPTMAINFSRSASQIIGQYYNFLRFGFEGYRKIHTRTKEAALYLSQVVEETGLFEIYNDGGNLPIVCYKLKENTQVEWNLYDLADRLQMKGWQVPAYPLPEEMDNVIIQRYVCRADFGQSMAEEFASDLNESIHDLNNAHILFHKEEINKTQGFTH